MENYVSKSRIWCVVSWIALGMAQQQSTRGRINHRGFVTCGCVTRIQRGGYWRYLEYVMRFDPEINGKRTASMLGMRTYPCAFRLRKKWYRGWQDRLCTWEKFREDLCTIKEKSRKRIEWCMHYSVLMILRGATLIVSVWNPNIWSRPKSPLQKRK